MRQDTINVVEISGDDGLISSLRAFPNTEQGVKEAEELFVAVVKETTDIEEDWQFQTCIENGFCDVPGGASIQLAHST